MLSSIECNQMKKLSQLVWRVFTKSYGLTLQAEAASFLIDKITSYSMDERQMSEFLNYMAQNYGKISKDRSGMVNKVNIELVFNQVFQSQDFRDAKGKVTDVRKYVKVIDAFKTPKFDFDVHEKVFKKVYYDSSFLGNSRDKIEISVKKYNFVKQRLLRQIRSGTLFPDFPSTFNLTPIKSIKGINSPTQIRYFLGVISEITEGSYSLEDPEDFIDLDFGALQEKPIDFIFEGCVVLVKGVCLGVRVRVDGIMVPPAEKRSETLSMLTHPDMMEATNFAEPLHELKQMEATAHKARLVILSEVWLDQPKIYDRLKVLFDGFNSQGSLPEIFVFIGPFSSNPPKDGPRAWSHYQDLFDGLAEFVEKLKNVRQTKFIFVPDRSDPGSIEDGILPRPRIPEAIFDAWSRSKLDFEAVSNPCRLMYFTQEIVIFRSDLTGLMRSKALNDIWPCRNREYACDVEMTRINSCSAESSLKALDMSDHQKSMKSVLDQASLSPISLNLQPTIWNHHHSLSLYPIPDAFIVAERNSSYEFNYEDCHCANPGSFASADGSFLVYIPALKKFELCEIPK